MSNVQFASPISDKFFLSLQIFDSQGLIPVILLTAGLLYWVF